MANIIRGIVSKNKKRFTQDGFDLDLTYVTPRIIAMGIPTTGIKSVYRNPLPEVKRFFTERHSGHYKVYNLCAEDDSNLEEYFPLLTRFPFNDRNPCPLKMIFKLCESVHAFLQAHPQNVVAIHCKAGKGRTGLMVSSYLIYSGLHSTAEEALDHFSQQRTYDWKGVTIPSQQRYVDYFSYILKKYPEGCQTLPTRCYALDTLEIHNGIFSNLHIDVRMMLHVDAAEWQENPLPILKQDDNPQNFMRTDDGKSTVIQFPDHFKIRGDVKFSVYSGRKRLFLFWFHTALVEKGTVTLGKEGLDKAAYDIKHKKFDANLGVTLTMQTTADTRFYTTFVEETALEGSEVSDSDSDTRPHSDLSEATSEALSSSSVDVE